MAFPPHQVFASDEEFYASLPLPQRHIRVLRLQPLRRGEIDSTPLRCELETVNLDNKRKRRQFTALSYTWEGSASVEHSIRCGTRSLNISVNLHSALVALRRLYGRVTLWVDAICIDQKNGTEKEHQIPLMGEIYSLATKVFIWLGLGTKSSNTAMDWIYDASKLALGSFSNGRLHWNDIVDLLRQGYIRIHGKCTPIFGLRRTKPTL
jgi:Heterokaryon incompatibility protein (HET)